MDLDDVIFEFMPFSYPTECYDYTDDDNDPFCKQVILDFKL